MNISKILFYFAVIQLLNIVKAKDLPDKTLQEQFIEFYRNELNSIAEDFVDKVKILSEKLLENKEFVKASTPEHEELQKSLKAFLKDYPHVKRYKVCDHLLATFINLIDFDIPNNNTENYAKEIKFQQLIKENFEPTLKSYEENYKKFIKDKFLNKFLDLEKQIDPVSLKELTNIKEKLKNCQNYQCFPTDYYTLMISLNKIDLMFAENTIRDLMKLETFRNIETFYYANDLINNTKLVELSLGCGENLTKTFNNFIEKFMEKNDIILFQKQLAEEQEIFEEQSTLYERNEQKCLSFKKNLRKFNTNYENVKTIKTKYEVERDNLLFKLKTRTEKNSNVFGELMNKIMENRNKKDFR